MSFVAVLAVPRVLPDRDRPNRWVFLRSHNPYSHWTPHLRLVQTRRFSGPIIAALRPALLPPSPPSLLRVEGGRRNASAKHSNTHLPWTEQGPEGGGARGRRGLH